MYHQRPSDSGPISANLSQQQSMDQTVRAPATDVASGAHRARAVEEGNCNNSTDDDKAQHDLHDESATSLASPCRSQLPQLPQPHDGASEAPISDSSASFSSASTEPARALQLRRSSSLHRAVFASSSGGSDSDRPGRRWRSDEQDSHNEDDRASSELVLQLQRLCRRQRQRAEERAFVRDVERVMALLRAPLPTSRDVQVTSATFPGYGLSLDLLSSGHESDTVAAVAVDEGQSSGTSDSSRFSTGRVRRSHDRRFASRVTLTLAEIDALLDCIADLFEHRNPDVRALAFEVVHLCVLRFGERLTPALRRKIYLQLESHPSKDFLLRQKVLRTLTHDGRHVEPFHVELGWFLLRLLEQSDAQKDLLGLIQSILRRSPRALDRDKVIAIVSVISGRCDIAWSRSDLDACHRSIAFFHVLATHDLAYAASTPACLRSLCCLVNADGHGTWSVMKLLLTGCSGFLVLRGLVQMLEHPTGVNSPWVLRGAVFFVGMSCWGSQRVAKFDDIAWGPILLALERALQCGRRVVVFEVILSIQRLIKKFGTAHLPAASGGQSTARSTNMSTKASPHCGDSREETSKVGSGFGPPNPGADSDKRCLIVEWDIILRMLHTLRPWASVTDESETEEFPERISQPNDRRMGGDVNQPAPVHPTNDLPDQPHPQLLVSIQQTRVPRELLDTLLAVEDLVERRRFAGDVKEFLNILEQYLPRLSEDSMLFLLRQRADATHPGYHPTWLTTLSSVMRTFFSGVSSDGDDLLIPRAVRLEALEILRVNLWTSRYVCEDRVIEEVVIPTLGQAYNDPDAEVRRRALGFIIEAARQLESAKFDSLLDILANAMIHSGDNDAQLLAASGVVSLFSSAFDHLPPARAVRMYDLLVTTVEVHRSRAVRRIALSCLLCVCEARAIDGRLQWKEQQQVRTSRFLFISRRSARVNSSNIQSTAARVPVARAFRALLSLVTAEPDAELFRIAVQGIKTMLENRTILEDVDVSEVSAKIVASIDYGAFGRAAIADEVDRMLGDHIGQQKLASVDASVCRDEKDREEHVAIDRLISQTNVELVHSIYVKRRRDDPDKSAKTFCTSLRATIVLLARTRYLGMGIELLQLLVSYDSELHYHTLQELTRCLVGCIESRLAVADKDFLMGGAAAEDSTSSLSASVSAPDMLYRHDGAEPEPRIAGTFVSDTPLGFTSRVLSRFQTSASHGSLFHAFSGSMGKSALEHKPGSKSPSEKVNTSCSRPTRSDQARLQGLLHQLFDSEFRSMHTTTTVLSLLAILSPASVLGQLDKMFQNMRCLITTVDGGFRPDAFVAMLELLGTITSVLHNGPEDKARSAREAIIKTVLLGFEYAKSKQIVYLAFRLLCQVIYQTHSKKERSRLATLAIPTLEQCAHRANSLLAEAAVDFLMCHAYTHSTSASSTLCSRQQSGSDDSGATRLCTDSRRTKSRSWVYRRSLLTITTNSRGNASLIIRRANCTSNWELGVGRAALSTSCPLFDVHNQSNYRPPMSDPLGMQPMGIIGDRSTVVPPRSLDRVESRPSYSRCQSRPHHGNDIQAVVSSYDEVRRRSRNERVVDSVGNAVSSNDCGAQAWCSPQESVSQQSADMTALPPLPAHDDIIESPSYCCENTQVRCHTQRKRDSLDCRSKSKQYRQAEGDDGEEGSSCRSVTRSKQEDAEESADVERRQELANNKRWETETDTVSHNDRLSDGLRLRVVTPSTLQSGEANPSTTGSVCGRDEYDPTCLMTQLFDLSVRNRPQLLRDGPALKLALNVLDRTPELETHKIGLLYVRDGKKPSESTILGTAGGSLRYLRFLRRLGTFTKLEGFPGYTGGLDTMNNSDGKFGLVYQDACAQIMFHVATMMVPQSYRRDSNPAAENFASMQKKRHIGNDFVHVVFKECDEDYDLRTISGQFNDVHIVIQPLNDHEYRTQVHVKQGIAPFGPLYGRQVVSSSIISECVRLTCMNANLACQVFHQDLIGFALNCEERLKQIKQLGLRLATSGDWNLDE